MISIAADSQARAKTAKTKAMVSKAPWEELVSF